MGRLDQHLVEWREKGRHREVGEDGCLFTRALVGGCEGTRRHLREGQAGLDERGDTGAAQHQVRVGRPGVEVRAEDSRILVRHAVVDDNEDGFRVMFFY